MANPTDLTDIKAYDNAAISATQYMDSTGTTVVTTQQANVADTAAITQVAVTDSLDGATFTGTALLTSTTPTVDELEAIAGMLGLAVNAAGTDIAAVRTTLLAVLDVLETHGLMADA